MTIQRFEDLISATQVAMQSGGRARLSRCGQYWYIDPEDDEYFWEPDPHYDPVHEHPPFAPVEGCEECARLGWLDAAPVWTGSEAAR